VCKVERTFNAPDVLLVSETFTVDGLDSEQLRDARQRIVVATAPQSFSQTQQDA
jgi:hypothetical protein